MKLTLEQCSAIDTLLSAYPASSNIPEESWELHRTIEFSERLKQVLPTFVLYGGGLEKHVKTAICELNKSFVPACRPCSTLNRCEPFIYSDEWEDVGFQRNNLEFPYCENKIQTLVEKLVDCCPEFTRVECFSKLIDNWRGIYHWALNEQDWTEFKEQYFKHPTED
eukprot:Lithocolla_globosa_v1_NODE_569_length_3713_cov_366.818480.p2 type:complete len:166 gc:universal NODE_569_length_3713_cov_366.818480:1840-1343(-)